LQSGDFGTWTVHVAIFFVDVRPELVARFAERHAISPETMARTYRSVRDETGERNSRLEAELVRLEEAASQDLRGLAKAGQAEFSHPELKRR
jgi:hypothetical protein